MHIWRIFKIFENSRIFAVRCYASAALAVMRCPCVCLSVRHVREFCQNE